MASANEALAVSSSPQKVAYSGCRPLLEMPEVGDADENSAFVDVVLVVVSPGVGPVDFE